MAGLAPLPALAQPTPRQAAEEAIRTLDLQPDLPGAGGGQDWWRGLDWAGPPAAESDDPTTLPADQVGDLLTLLGGVCGIALLAAWLLDARPGWGRRRADPARSGRAPAEAGAEKSPGEVLAASDGLAATGRFADAMHLLLLDGLALIRRRRPEALADSLTSREILGRLMLPPPAQRGLAEMVTRVEGCWFGDHPAGPADYAACRDAHAGLVRAVAAEGGR